MTASNVVVYDHSTADSANVTNTNADLEAKSPSFGSSSSEASSSAGVTATKSSRQDIDTKGPVDAKTHSTVSSLGAKTSSTAVSEAFATEPDLSRTAGTPFTANASADHMGTSVAPTSAPGSKGDAEPTAGNDSIKALDTGTNIPADAKPTSFDFAAAGAKDTLAGASTNLTSGVVNASSAAAVNTSSTAFTANDTGVVVKPLSAEAPSDTNASVDKAEAPGVDAIIEAPVNAKSSLVARVATHAAPTVGSSLTSVDTFGTPNVEANLKSPTDEPASTHDANAIGSAPHRVAPKASSMSAKAVPAVDDPS